ncbi:MAG: RnfABCDGE type electron transport complex subunit G [Bacteroidales bacterium]|nr:RnfABCDGE type electron transport complex subunit G [Bacteroidales bacterium]MCF8336838.1 RnfABCDGE type electron transport complex subunit G [Bacteroidales bacterium]
MSKQKKPESTFPNMVIALLLVTMIAGLALGGVYVVTKEPIAAAKRAKLENALGKVLPEFDTLKNKKVPAVNGNDSLAFYTGYRNGSEVGTAVKTYTEKGYDGRFDIMVGFTPDNRIENTAVLNHTETPGLGDKIEKSKSDWSKQFNGKNPEQFQLKVKKDGGDVDAITAATISSRAFCDATKRAYETYEKEGGVK